MTGPGDDVEARGYARAWRSHRGLVVAGIAIVVVLAILAGGLFVYARVLDDRIERTQVRLHPSRSGGTTYLILGSDSRKGVSAAQAAGLGDVAGSRADIVLLVRVPDDGPPTMVSIPRDLLVLGTEDLGLHRLALSLLQGPQRTVDVLCKSLGIGEDHLVEIDLAGFTDIVDAVGGIDVETATPIRDTVLDFQLDAGKHHLDGATALLYMRARHLERGAGDVWLPIRNQRSEQARTVIEQVADQSELSITDPVGAHDLLWALTENITVDSGTGLRDLRKLASSVRDLDQNADVRLPALEEESGPIPFAELVPGAGAKLRAAGSGGPGCRRPALRLADS